MTRSNEPVHVVPVDDWIEHVESYLCPCQPERLFRDPMTGVEVWGHFRLADGDRVH